jgi:adenylate cyclase
MIEIERKFLVKTENFPKSGNKTILKQGYLSVDPERVVRVRIEENLAWITIKGKMKIFSRPEFEYEIPVEDAENLLLLSVNPPIEKIRHRITIEGMLWEVDEFLALNQGLLLAEIELESETQEISLPEWVGEEVTSDPRYFNSWLSVHPYTTWGNPH